MNIYVSFTQEGDLHIKKGDGVNIKHNREMKFGVVSKVRKDKENAEMYMEETIFYGDLWDVFSIEAEYSYGKDANAHE